MPVRPTLALGLALVAAAAGAVAAQPAPPPAPPPLDLVLAVDVSLSMFGPARDNFVPNDPGGIRWDGVQFLIDTAGPDDRVALVMFRGDAALPTRHFDPSGFVKLGAGDNSPRRELKRLVAEAQAYERDYPPGPDKNPDYSLLDGKVKFRLSHGTASLPTLAAVAAPWRLLDAGPENRQKLVVLFTDGMDQAPYEAEKRPALRENGFVIEYGTPDFAHVADVPKEYDSDRDKKDAKRADAPSDGVRQALRRKVEDVAAPFRKAGVPVFTFGLYNPDRARGTSPYELAVMRETLPALARRSLADLARDPRFVRFPASYESVNNLELLESLQVLGWELRERWQLRPAGTPAPGGGVRFATPDRQLCAELGALLYTPTGGADGRTALAPRRTQADGEVLEGRSHHFAWLRPGAGPTEIVAEPSVPGGAVTAVMGVRPNAPLLTYLAPDPGLTYSPLDAIPVVLEFDPLDRDAAEKKLDPGQFEVVADVTPPGEKARPRRVVLAPGERGPDGKWKAAGAVVPDADRRPDGPATPGLDGLWTFDVTVTAKSGPLAGATRKLLRRQVAVGPYPGLRDGPALRVSNRGADPGRGETTFTIPLLAPGPADAELATLAVDLVLPKDGGWAGLTPPRLDRATVRGDGKAVVKLDLTGPQAFDWSRVPAAGLRAKVVAKAPWGGPPAEADLVVTKERYPLKVGDARLAFDLSGTAAEKAGPTAADVVRVRLDTDLATAEKVVLSAAETGAPTDEVRVKSASGKDEFTLKLARTAAADVPGGRAGGADRYADVKVELVRPPAQPPSGTYTGAVWLVPEKAGTTDRAKVEVTVRVNQPVLLVDGRPASRVRLPVLAGGRVQQQLAVALQDPGQKQTITAVAAKLDPALVLESAVSGPAGTIPTAPAWLTPGRDPTKFGLAVRVPPGVVGGVYHADAKCEVKARTEGAQPVTFTVPWRVEVEVFRQAVEVSADPPDGAQPRLRTVPAPAGYHRLRPPTGAAPDEVVLPVTLTTPLKGMPVRWWARLVEDEPGPAGAVPWFKDRLGVYEAEDGKPGMSVLDPERRTLPVAEQAERKLLVVARKTADLPPGAYRCRVRFFGMLDGDEPPPEGEDPPHHFDLPVEVFVRGRAVAVDRAGDGRELRATVATWGCLPGVGVVRSPDRPGWSAQVGSPGKQAPKAGEPYRAPPVALPPDQPGGLTEYRLYWPRRPDDLTPPDADDPRPEEFSLDRVTAWKKPQLAVEPRVAAAGDTVRVRLPLTRSTTGELKGPLAGRVTLRGAKEEAAPIDFKLEPDKAGGLAGSFKFPDGATPGVYVVGVAAVPGPDGVAAGERTADPVAVLLGLHLQRPERALGPIFYHKLFVGDDQVSAPDFVRLKNDTPRPVQYRARVLFPRTTADSQAIGDRALPDLPLGDYDPGMHLDVKLANPEGTIAPGHELALELQAGLSPEATAAYLDNQPHPTLAAKNGAVVELELTGVGADGQPFRWVTRQPLSVETQTWRKRGWLYGTVAAVLAGLALYFGYPYLRRLINKLTGEKRPSDLDPDPTSPPLPPPPQDPMDNLFGTPPG